MQARYIDAHCHVQFEHYARDEAQVIERMAADGIAGIVTGVDLASSKRAVALAELHEHLYAAVGLHPNAVGREPFDAAAYRALAAHPKVVAIGECGLDYYRAQQAAEKAAFPAAEQAKGGSSAYYRPIVVDAAVKGAQQDAFRAHIALAAALDKPLVLHVRPAKGTQDAYADVIRILQEAKTENPTLRGDVHFFVGGVLEADALVALGFTLSFTAVITFARDYDAVVKHVPLASILSETDAPYVAPASRRGERNDPLAVEDVVRQVAYIRGEDPETVRRALVGNALRVFGLPGTAAA
ncbi:MAG TPA: TatD family hydrolase [Candidatus Paceibacterota bacterium]|nr:TatD family hydrolase [Candidatus Paceibacterota bacterium]